MNISLDYDDTYTRDPNFWNKFIVDAQSAGHTIYGVTMRYPEECFGGVFHEYESRIDHLVPTGRMAKRPFMYAKGINIDVWIDDRPDFIIIDARKE